MNQRDEIIIGVAAFDDVGEKGCKIIIDLNNKHATNHTWHQKIRMKFDYLNVKHKDNL